ncbi:MAG: Uma2 family endonuclease [Rhizonema sp. PD37]|nr:Uma2 family endonuclease [Rhizonema sp. PD37]
MVQIEVRQIRVPPGQRVQLENISWMDFEAILAELGERRATRIAYSERILEIMAPLPEHETAKVFIGDFVKILLDEMSIEWISLGSTTFKQQLMAVGIEPDDCFYIQNCARMVGRERLDLTVDPPPDLAIEVDLTSRTQISAYEALKVPEVWCYHRGNLQISVLQDGFYVDSLASRIFPDFPLLEIIPQFIKRGQIEVMSSVRRAFQQWVRSAIER